MGGYDPWARLRYWNRRKLVCTHCEMDLVKRTLSQVLVCQNCDEIAWSDGVFFPQEWILEQLNAIRHERAIGLIDGPMPEVHIRCRCTLLPYEHPRDQHKDMT